MDRQGFDPMGHDINQVVDFMEQIEAAEDFDPNPKNKSKDKSKGKGKNNQPKKSGNGKSNEFCLYHGECGHSTEDCSVIKSLASQKKAKTNNSNNRGNSSGNWKKRAEEHGNKSKKDLAAFIKKEVKKGVDKGLAEKKRKATEEGELDLNALEAELNEFNYEDMENLTMDDKSTESC